MHAFIFVCNRKATSKPSWLWLKSSVDSSPSNFFEILQFEFWQNYTMKYDRNLQKIVSPYILLLHCFNHYNIISHNKQLSNVPLYNFQLFCHTHNNKSICISIWIREISKTMFLFTRFRFSLEGLWLRGRSF